MSVESPSTQGRRRASVRSVDQTLDVLELLARADRPVGVTEMARILGLSPPGVHRLLATLRDRGYAAQDPATGRYTRGLACFRLAALAASRQTLRAVADDHLRALNESTGEAVHLTVYESGNVVYIDKLESHHETAPVSRVGEQAPAHCVATGRAIIAFLPRSEVDVLIDRGLQPFTEATIVERDELLADLELTRARGYALNRGSWRAAVGGVAAPIRDFSGTVQASVGCCLPLERLTEDTTPRLAAQTIRTAAAISEELGFVVPEAAA